MLFSVLRLVHATYSFGFRKKGRVESMQMTAKIGLSQQETRFKSSPTALKTLLNSPPDWIHSQKSDQPARDGNRTIPNGPY